MERPGPPVPGGEGADPGAAVESFGLQVSPARRSELVRAHLDPDGAPVRPLRRPAEQGDDAAAARTAGPSPWRAPPARDGHADQLLDLGLVEVAALLERGEVAATDLVTAQLQRIHERNPALGALVTVTADIALAAAREADAAIRAGGYRGALAGIPVAVKDLIAVAGVPMTAGSAVLEGHVPTADAAATARLRECGAAIVGTAALDEFAFATTGQGIVNPVDASRSPGGSSGGSAAAVAAGLCFTALGTDTGGSVRIPATCCDVVGVKPTAGTIATAGVVPLAWSLDHVGVLARSVPDAAAALAAVSPGTGTGAAVPGLAGRRIGVPGEAFLAVAQPAVREAFTRACDLLASQGADLVTVTLPSSHLALDVQYLVVLAESAAYHFGRHRDRLDRYGAGVRAALDWGATVRAIDYLDAQRVRTTMTRTVDEALAGVDCLALPAMAITPPAVGQDEVVLGDGSRDDASSAMLRFTCMFNHTGHPAVSVPAAAGDSGTGVQFVGRHFAEGPLLAIASGYERSLGG